MKFKKVLLILLILSILLILLINYTRKIQKFKSPTYPGITQFLEDEINAAFFKAYNNTNIKIQDNINITINSTVETIIGGQYLNNLNITGTAIPFLPSPINSLITFKPTNISGIGEFDQTKSKISISNLGTKCTDANCQSIPFTMVLTNKPITFTGELWGNIGSTPTKLDTITLTMDTVDVTITGSLEITCAKTCAGTFPDSQCPYTVSKIITSTSNISISEINTSQSWSTFMTNILDDLKSILNKINDAYCTSQKISCSAECIALGSIGKCSIASETLCKSNCYPNFPICNVECAALYTGSCGIAQAECSTGCTVLGSGTGSCGIDQAECSTGCFFKCMGSSSCLKDCNDGCHSDWHSCMGTCDTDDYPNSFP